MSSFLTKAHLKVLGNHCESALEDCLKDARHFAFHLRSELVDDGRKEAESFRIPVNNLESFGPSLRLLLLKKGEALKGKGKAKARREPSHIVSEKLLVTAGLAFITFHTAIRGLKRHLQDL